MKTLQILGIALCFMLSAGQVYAVDAEALGDELTSSGQSLRTSDAKDSKNPSDDKELNEKLEEQTPPAPTPATA